MPLGKSSKPPPPKSPKDFDAELKRRVHKIALSIRADSNGEICGTCAHAVLSDGGSGECMALINLNGQALSILSYNAVACRVSYLRARS